MIDEAIHLYDKLPLQTAGIAMGLALVLLHLPLLLKPAAAQRVLAKAHEPSPWGTTLLAVDFLWIALLLFDASWNPLRMPLFEFDGARHILLLLCPVGWFVLATMAKENLFPRALGLFLLLMAIVPMSAAFLKEPATRILIPLWWYPVLTVAMFWVAKPYLFRDWAAWLAGRNTLLRGVGLFGVLYGAAVLICALLFW